MRIEEPTALGQTPHRYTFLTPYLTSPHLTVPFSWYLEGSTWQGVAPLPCPSPVALGERELSGVTGGIWQLGEKPIGHGLRHFSEDCGPIPVAHVVLHILGRGDLLACFHI